MIIVEGPDGGGKSNLVARICEDFQMDVEPKVVGADTKIIGGTSLKNWVDQDIQSWPRAAIYDRHRLISEPIYAPIMRGRLADGFENPLWYGTRLGVFWKHRPIVVYCLPPIEEVVKNVANAETDNEVVCRAISGIYWLYHVNYCQNMHRANVMAWDYTQDTWEDFQNYLHYILKEEFHQHDNVIDRYFVPTGEATAAPEKVLRK